MSFRNLFVPVALVIGLSQVSAETPAAIQISQIFPRNSIIVTPENRMSWCSAFADHMREIDAKYRRAPKAGHKRMFPVQNPPGDFGRFAKVDLTNGEFTLTELPVDSKWAGKLEVITSGRLGNGEATMTYTAASSSGEVFCKIEVRQTVQATYVPGEP